MTNLELTFCLICIALLTGMSLAQAEMRILPYTNHFAYGLRVQSPWDGAGEVVINFPEHLEYMPGTRGILRYSDKDPKGYWKVEKRSIARMK